MKRSAILSFFLFASLANAHSFVVEGTNVIQIQLQDEALNEAQKEFIGTDIVRTLTPGAIFSKLHHPSNQPPSVKYLDYIPKPETPDGVPTFTRKIEVYGTNLTLTVDKDYTDCYLSRVPFFNTHSNAIAQAFVFANLLVTNPISGMADSMLKGVRLSKAYAPDQLPLEHAADIRLDLGRGVYFPPSLLGFQMLPYGPAGSEQYLWGILPNRTSYSVDSIPIIYYQNRWWISYWHLEEIEQAW